MEYTCFIIMLLGEKAQQLQFSVDGHQKQLIYQNQLILAVSILGLRSQLEFSAAHIARTK